MIMKPMKPSLLQRFAESISMRGAVIGASIFIVTLVVIIASL